MTFDKFTRLMEEAGGDSGGGSDTATATDTGGDSVSGDTGGGDNRTLLSGGGEDPGGDGGTQDTTGGVNGSRFDFINDDLSFAPGWEEKLSDDHAGLRSTAANIKSIPGALQALRDTKAELTRAQQALKDGTPQIPDEYTVAAPEGTGVELSDSDIEAYQKLGKDLGLTQEQLEKQIAHDVATAIRSQSDAEQAQREYLAQQDLALREKWGRQYETNLDYATRFAMAHGIDLNDPILKEAKYVDLFARAGQAISEDRLPGSETKMSRLTPNTRADDIRSNPNNPDHEAFWKSDHPRHNQVVNEVLELEKQATRGRNADIQTLVAPKD